MIKGDTRSLDCSSHKSPNNYRHSTFLIPCIMARGFSSGLQDDIGDVSGFLY